MTLDRIRICYIIDNLSFRGGERTFAQLISGLDCKQYDIHVICSPGGRFVDLVESVGVPVFPVDMRHKWNFGAVWPMVHYLRERQFDIVHTQGRGDPFGRLAARLAGVPLIFSTVAMIMSRYWGVSLRRRVLYQAIDWLTDPLVDQWIVVNHESIETLIQDHHVSRQQITVVLNGIEPEQYASSTTARTNWRNRWQIKNDTLVVGAIGKLTWQKGFEYLIRAWPQVRATVPQAQLFIIGEGELLQPLKRLANKLGEAKYCTFTGFETDVATVLSGLDLFVLPSMVEGLPMVLLEAMAAGKPVVASCIPATLEVVTDGFNGLLVERGDVAGLACRLVTLLQSPSLRMRLGQVAQQTIQQNFTVTRMIQETEARYRQALVSHYVLKGYN